MTGPDADGFLKFPDFIEGLLASRFLYQMRLIGGLFYFVGYVLMIVNLLATVRAGKAVTHEAAGSRDHVQLRMRFAPAMIDGDGEDDQAWFASDNVAEACQRPFVVVQYAP